MFGVATDMFINYIDNSDSSVFVDVAKVKNRIEELRKLID